MNKRGTYLSPPTLFSNIHSLSRVQRILLTYNMPVLFYITFSLGILEKTKIGDKNVFLLPLLHLNEKKSIRSIKKPRINNRTSICIVFDKCDSENMISYFNGFPLLEVFY